MNFAIKQMNAIYNARLEMFGKEDAMRWLKVRKNYYERLGELADRKGFKTFAELHKWQEKNREEYERFMK